MLATTLLATAAALPAGFEVPAGPYKTNFSTFDCADLDFTNRKIDVVYPLSQNADEKFPVISYAHGFSDTAYTSYTQQFDYLASWGYVVVAPLSCKYGCLGDCKELSLLDPPCFGNYYKEQLKALEWSQSAAAASLPVNKTSGAGIAGHSMGGQATALSAALENASAYGIKAAAMQHPYTHTYPASTVPFLAFTGTDDDVASPSMVERLFDAAGAAASRGLVNKRGANHHEPSTQYNPFLGLATVAWMKLFVDGTPSSGGVDWADILYTNSSSSLCGGGDGAMQQCTMLGGPGGAAAGSAARAEEAREEPPREEAVARTRAEWARFFGERELP
jgi:dienelactone hydrolase